jgi:hypothetical protein
MATFDYAETRRDADELIREFGGPAKLRVRGGTTTAPNPTPWEPGGEVQLADTDYDVVAVVIDYSQRERESTNIQSQDKQALISALDDSGNALAVSPSAADALVFGGVEYAIVQMSPLDPGGSLPVMFTAQVRR